MRVKFRTRPIRNFFEIASLLLGLVVVALVSAITTMHFAIHGAEVKVPGLKGMTVAEARSQTAGLRLNLEVDDRFYSADVAAGHILSQSPLRGRWYGGSGECGFPKAWGRRRSRFPA